MLNGATQGEVGLQIRQMKIKSSIMWLQLLFFDFLYIYKSLFGVMFLHQRTSHLLMQLKY